jgi:hypothetical protein
MYTFELPSGSEIVLREMTGVEEEILTNQRLIRSGDAVNQVLRNCIVKLGDKDTPSLEDVLSMLSGDRLFALVRLRQVSLGDDIDLELVCPNQICRKPCIVHVNIEDLEVSYYGERREFEFKLPGSGSIVRFGYLDGNKEKRLSALQEPTISSAMLIRIIDIDGKSPDKKTVSAMSLRDRTALRGEMARVDGGIDTVVDTECEAVGLGFEHVWRVRALFYSPDIASE